MSERPTPQAADEIVGEHGKPEDHDSDPGHDDHAHGGEALGPFDLPAWGAAGLGIVLGLVVVFAFLQAAA